MKPKEAKTSPQKSKVREVEDGEPTCYYCKKKGHLNSECQFDPPMTSFSTFQVKMEISGPSVPSNPIPNLVIRTLTPQLTNRYPKNRFTYEMVYVQYYSM